MGNAPTNCGQSHKDKLHRSEQQDYRVDDNQQEAFGTNNLSKNIASSFRHAQRQMQTELAGPQAQQNPRRDKREARPTLRRVYHLSHPLVQ